MKQHQPGHRVVEAGLHRQIAHRHHQDLEGHEIAGDEHEEQRHREAEPVDGQRIAGKAGQRD